MIVADNGPGFLDDFEFLTEPFFTRKPDGMGLGLHISDEVMKQHNGKLLILEHGDVDLPSGFDGAIVAMQFPGNCMTGLQTSRVIVVDDDPTEVEGLLRGLSSIRIGALYFNGDPEELPKAPIDGIRLVFLDLHLVAGAGDSHSVPGSIRSAYCPNS